MDEGKIWLIIPGVLLLLVAATLEAYCEFGRQAAPKYRPDIFRTRTGVLFWIGWITLFLIACIMLFFAHPIAGFIAIVVFWLLLPLWLVPMMRKRMLPPWDIVKDELENQGYTEDNYTSGDWWRKKKDSKKVAMQEPDKKTEGKG